MEVLPHRFVPSALVLVCVLLAGLAAQTPPPYLVISSEGTRPLPIYRATGTTDMVALDVVARFFELPLREDARTGGVVLAVRAQRVVLTAGQATVSAGGRLVALSTAVTKDGATWLVPIDFLRVLAPLLERPIDIRRASRLIVMGTASVPRLAPRFERTATGGRLTVTLDPGVAARVTRDGSLVTVRFQADALDLGPLSGAPSDLLTNIRAEGAVLLLDLGPAVVNVRQEETRDPSRLTLDFIGATTTAPARPDALPPPPPIERPGTLRTIVVDPGHGGDDVGSRSAAGLEEKQVTLAVARRLKAMLESRLGVRVILTRDSDTAITIDRRAALANNNKADLFISLHANGSPVASVRGWQVQALDPADYASVGSSDGFAAQSVPVVGGGSRVIDTVPWQLAQIPHAARSLTLAQWLAARLGDAGLPAHSTPVLQAPLRALVGANMPAVLLELGFLTNADDTQTLGSAAFHTAVSEVITTVINEARAGVPPAGGGGDR
ncbi:MAG: N-acetylmuramoyl-L-alanine amidase [Acidobacteria bacterium]|nr:N-acetylmuramoyl-L-alanine amidase [Acidobacteriota bacterium]